MTDTPPTEVTLRELTELVRTFADTGWASLDLQIHGMHVVLGRDGPPAAASAPAPVGAAVAPTPAPAVAPVAATPAATAPAPAAAPAAPAPATPPAAPVGTADVPADAVEVRSPAVGSFWVSPSPGQPPFAAVGDRVEADQQLAIVEVMKLMNAVSAPVAGTVVEVCVSNADLVEYDQVLFRIAPGDG